MADHTAIEWTDATWNVVTGCSVVSAGCKHCYAMKLAGTRLKHDPSRAGLTVQTQAGPVWNGQVRFNEQWLDQPLRWKRPRRIFVCAHGDLFHESVPFDWIDRVFAVMALAPQHTFQVLTKRPERMREYLGHDDAIGRAGFIEGRARQMVEIPHGKTLAGAFPLRNVWLGVSVEDQAAANARIPLLLETPAAVRWISAEPLLGPVDLTDVTDGHAWREVPREYWLEDFDTEDSPPALRWDAIGGMKYQRFGDYEERSARIDWVVAGGESGPGARPMHPDWARSLRDQCAAAGVAFVFKQWGAWAPLATQLCEARALSRTTAVSASGCKEDRPAGAMKTSDALMELVGKKVAGRLLDGVQHDGYPVMP